MTKQAILNALRQIVHPKLNRDIVSLGAILNMKRDEDWVSFELSLQGTDPELKEKLKLECEKTLMGLPGLNSVKISFSDTPGAASQKAKILPGVQYTIAVASGKGGVGKSTVTANLAVSLAKAGKRVGLLDCDIYGPSMPLMFGVAGQKPDVTEDEQVVPITAHGVKLMSIGFLSSDKAPVIWRGPMVHQMIQQFLTRIAWGELDYLLLDLPPGTGDAQLTLTQTAPLSGAIVVTTPQEVSLIDARKGLQMFEKVNVPVVGIIENMSYFECPDTGKKHEIFKRGGVEKFAADHDVSVIGEIPIDPAIATCGDEGTPAATKYPESKTAEIYNSIAEIILREVSQSGNSVDSIDIQWQS